MDTSTVRTPAAPRTSWSNVPRRVLRWPQVLAPLAGAALALLFYTNPFDSVYREHFASWERLQQEPTGQLALTLSRAKPTLAFVVVVFALIAGVVSGVRAVVAAPWRPAVVVVGVYIWAVMTEWVKPGAQDGSVPDLEAVPPFGVFLLVVSVVFPLVLLAIDLQWLRQHRLEFREHWPLPSEE